MKKIIAFLICSLLIFTAVYPVVWARASQNETEYFEDGSYLTVTYIRPAGDDSEGDWEHIDAAESVPSPLTRIIRWLKDIISRLFAKQETIVKTKYCNYFDSDGKLIWTVMLKASFIYNHRKAVCVSSEITYEIKDADWKMLSYSSEEEGSTATGDFSIRQYKLGVPLKIIERTLTLTCDKEGNVI